MSTSRSYKGLKGMRIFRDYYLRNALLPQVTGFALALEVYPVTSAIVIEGIFGLPGIGTKVLQNTRFCRTNDFPVIYAIMLFITIAVAAIMIGMEFVYPFIDPRIRPQ